MSISIVETTTTLAANTPLAIAPAAPGCTLLIISNTGVGSLAWKTGAAPSSAADGTTLDPASSAGGQGGSIVLTGAIAISDKLFAWSTSGTTVNVKQGSPV